MRSYVYHHTLHFILSICVFNNLLGNHETNGFVAIPLRTQRISSSSSTTTSVMFMNDRNQQIAKRLEEARMNVLTGHRKNIRKTFKTAEQLRNFRIDKGFVPELDQDGKPVKSDSKTALTLTAFAIGIGAVVLRVGGRAVLMSSLGLDFASENPELKEGLDNFLEYAGSMDPLQELLVFVLAWTGVKVFCLDAGGVVLALSAGILFGGVIKGGVVSAFAATVGSSVAFGLAKLKSPLREKALEIVEEYPSLRGIERVVAQDGVKAILTLRLAPILPIPIGMYNYVYGVTNVPYLDFAAGIFLGSLKPYLLDSYLGWFGKSVVDGSAGEAGGMQDALLLTVLAAGTIIGVFASQLAGETWDSVTAEIEAEKNTTQGETEKNDELMVEFMGMNLPRFAINMQINARNTGVRLDTLVMEESMAKVWNFTEEGSIPEDQDPARSPQSFEMMEANKGFDFGRSVMEALLLSPVLIQAFLKLANPLYDEATDADVLRWQTSSLQTETQVDDNDDNEPTNSVTIQDALRMLEELRQEAEKRLEQIDDQLL